MRRFLSILLCLTILLGLSPAKVWASPAWPDQVSIEAEGGIVMDADTGTVIYGKNIHTPYFPASITKILTALIVIEHCDLDETVTFSHNAVYNVEANSSSAGLDEGDQLSVRDCLYAMLLKSANESANALAEHVAGSIEDFAVMMNEKARSLGCLDSNFVNPSGLNNPEHYTSAYDMALIGQAAIQNKTFVEIDSTLYYDLPVTKRNREGLRVYPGHRMIKRNMAEYYSGAFGGKTGYTTLAGNTLVTFAERDGVTLVAVILNGHQTHYRDTKALLDFGFSNFYSITAADYDKTFADLGSDMTIAGLSASGDLGLFLDKTGRIFLPKNADYSAVTSQLSYDLPESTPSGAIAQINYFFGDRKVGNAYLMASVPGTPSPVVPSTTLEAITGITLESTEVAEVSEPTVTSIRIPGILKTVLLVILVLALFIGAVILLKYYQEKRETSARIQRREKRLQRMQDSGCSPVEFDLLMEKKRSSIAPKRKLRRKFPFFK